MLERGESKHLALSLMRIFFTSLVLLVFRCLKLSKAVFISSLLHSLHSGTVPLIVEL